MSRGAEDRALALVLAIAVAVVGALAVFATRAARTAAPRVEVASRPVEPAPPPAADAWHDRAAPPRDVAPGVLARVASRTVRELPAPCGVAPAPDARAPGAAAANPGAAARAGAAQDARCAAQPEDGAEVEIDWDASPAPR